MNTSKDQTFPLSVPKDAPKQGIELVSGKMMDLKKTRTASTQYDGVLVFEQFHKMIAAMLTNLMLVFSAH